MRVVGQTALLAKQDTHLAASANVVIADQVVGVAVADRNPEAAVLHDDVLLGQAKLDAPAEEQALIIALDFVGANERALRA